jgi:uncharacterized membrane protein (UPF0127 family)
MQNIKRGNMKKRKVIVHFGGKKIELFAEECNIFEKGIGLMFSKREKARILLFRFKNEQKIRIHSFFVFYPFIAIWLDKQGKIIDMKIVNPFLPHISHKGLAVALIEIPINQKNKEITKFLTKSRRGND